MNLTWKWELTIKKSLNKCLHQTKFFGPNLSKQRFRLIPYNIFWTCFCSWFVCLANIKSHTCLNLWECKMNWQNGNGCLSFCNESSYVSTFCTNLLQINKNTKKESYVQYLHGNLWEKEKQFVLTKFSEIHFSLLWIQFSNWAHKMKQYLVTIRKDMPILLQRLGKCRQIVTALRVVYIQVNQSKHNKSSLTASNA